MTLLRLFNRFVVRDLLRRPLRTLLTLFGVALGLGVVVAVHLAAERAVGSFTQSLEILSGDAHLQITANGPPLDETLFADLAWIWEQGSMAPLLEGRGRLPDGETVRIYGIDVLSDSAFRRYVLEDGGELDERMTREVFPELLQETDRALVPADLARRLGLGEGDPFPILLRDRPHRLTVVSLLSSRGAAAAFGGNVLFLDIAAAQLLLDRIGELDRIDVRLHADEKLEEVEGRLLAELPPAAAVLRPEDRTEQNRRMLRAFRFNLTALSYVALLVGMILVYNTLHLAVVRRRGEIGALRTLGTSRSTVMALFLGEALLFGLGGALAALWLGRAMAEVSERLVSRTIETLYAGPAALQAAAGQDPALLLQVLALGGVLGLVSGFFPAWSATRISPVRVLRTGSMPSDPKQAPGKKSLMGLLLLALGALASLAPSVDGIPLAGYGSILCFLAGAGLLTPLLARELLRLPGALCEWISPVAGRLALRSIQGGLPRVVVAVISLMVAVSMLVSVATMVGSFRETVVVWLDQTLRADLFIRAGGAGSQDWTNPLSPETVESIRRMPGVRSVERFRGLDLDWRGRRIVVAATDLEVVAAEGTLALKGRADTEAVARSLQGSDRVLISEPLALREGMRQGDALELVTPQGEREFRVEAVVYDYSSDRGAVTMDRSTFLRHFGDAAVTNLSVYLEHGQTPEEFRERMAAALPETRLQVSFNSDLRRRALQVFDQTFRVTYALEVIAILVAVLGITATMSALILERKAEIAVLRFLGADPGQIRRAVLAESALVGFLGVLLGLFLGLLLSLVLIFVVNRQSFGWTIQMQTPVEFLAWALTLVFLCTLAAGLYPAAEAARTDPIRSLRTE